MPRQAIDAASVCTRTYTARERFPAHHLIRRVPRSLSIATYCLLVHASSYSLARCTTVTWLFAGPHQTTSFVCIRPHSSAHSGSSCTVHMTAFVVKSLCHPVVHFVGTGDVDLVAPCLVDMTSFVTILVWSPPFSEDKLYCETVVRSRSRGLKL